MADEFDPPEHGPLRDNSTVWRLTIWGSAAIVAVSAAVLITQFDLGVDRMLQAFSLPKAETQKVALEDDLLKRVETQRVEEARRLEARVRELTADRDKLTSRIAALEQNFGDMTGSIKRDIAAIAATVPAKSETPRPAPQPAAPAPVLTAPPATTAPQAPTPVPPASDAKVEPKLEPKIEPKAERQPEPAPVAEAPPPQIVNVPMPPAAPMRVASAPPALPEEEKPPAPGIELGGARSLDILNARWVAVKANFGPLIEGLSPLMRHEDRPGIIPYRLIVGPLPNRAAAAQLCSRFAASKVPCRTTDFTGEKLVQQP